MSLTLQDEELTRLIRIIAERRKQSPDQVVADALFDHLAPEERDSAGFWQAIRGIGDSGNPDTAHRTKEILRNELDDQEGWNTGNAPNGTH